MPSFNPRLPGVIAFASGAAALMHQLFWTRRLIDLIGASAESMTRVFGVFFLGLALGAASSSRRQSAAANPWRGVARSELCIALLALPALLLPWWSDWIWPFIGAERLAGWQGGMVKLLLSLICILPPAFFMGRVLPWLAGTPEGVRSVRLYAWNTLGGLAGVIAGTWCVGKVEMPVAMSLAIGLNVVIAAMAFHRARGETRELLPPETSAALPSAVLLGIAALSGAGILALEVASNQLLMLVATLSFHAPAAILFAVILLLGAGSAAAAGLRCFGGRSIPKLALALASAAPLIAVGPVAFMFIVSRWNFLAENSSTFAFQLKLVLLLIAAVGPGFLAAALVFPLVISAIPAGLSGSARRDLGLLLAVNGLGGLVGGEACHRILLPAFGVHISFGVIAILYAVAALLLSTRLSLRIKCGAATATAVSILMALFALKKLPVVNTHAGFTLVEVRTGREGSVAVVDSSHLGRSIVMSNQYLLGSSAAQFDQERQGLLPLLLHPHPRELAFLGLATGSTSGVALDIPEVGHVTAVELSPLVVDAATRHFAAFNHRVCSDPRSSVIAEDARTFIAASPGRFDVITGDLFLPWNAGEGRLYSLEHFRAVRRSLRPGGVFCQWLAMYQLTASQFAIIADTFHAAFGSCHLYCAHFRADSPVVGLVAFEDASPPDAAVICKRCARVREAGTVPDPLFRHAEGLELLSLGTWNPHGSRLNTLSNLALELDAGARRISGSGEPYLSGPYWVGFAKGFQATAGAGGAGVELIALDHEARLTPADRNRHVARMKNLIPPALFEDPGSDWHRWPGSFAPVVPKRESFR